MCMDFVSEPFSLTVVHFSNGCDCLTNVRF